MKNKDWVEIVKDWIRAWVYLLKIPNRLVKITFFCWELVLILVTRNHAGDLHHKS